MQFLCYYDPHVSLMMPVMSESAFSISQDMLLKEESKIMLMHACVMQTQKDPSNMGKNSFSVILLR